MELNDPRVITNGSDELKHGQPLLVNYLWI